MLYQILDKYNKGAKLISVDSSILDRNMFSNLLTARRKAELQPFNDQNIDLEEEQFVIIINEEFKMSTTLQDSMRTHATHPLQQMIDLVQMMDKYQAAPVLMKELKKVIFGWTSDLIEKNNEFWHNLRDNFNHLFVKRRFRLELAKNQTDASKSLIGSAEQNIHMIESDEGYDIYKPKTDEYALVAEADKKYADSCDQQFKNTQRNQDTERAILELMQKLIEWEQYSSAIHIWAVLASSFEHYHLALSPDILQAIIPWDNNRIVEQMYPVLMYLMYREECCVKRDVTPNHRFVTSLKDWTQAGLKLRGTYVSPIAHTHRPVRDGADTHGSLRSFSDFKQILGKLTMNCLSDFKAEGFVATGGLISLCAIRSQLELQRSNNKDIALQHMLDAAYSGADLDIAIFAQDEKDYLNKIALLQDHINKKLSSSECKSSSLITDKSVITFKPKDSAPGRYRLLLPNNIPIEVFQVKQGRNAMSLVYNFHVPCVRMSYNFQQDDLFMLPSALHAGLTGVCLDIKYFASSSTPMQIVRKYMDRGFSFVLNPHECEILGIRYPRLKLLRLAQKYRYPCLKSHLWRCIIKRNKSDKKVSQMVWRVTPPEIPSINLLTSQVKVTDSCSICDGRMAPSNTLTSMRCGHCCFMFGNGDSDEKSADSKFFSLSTEIKRCVVLVSHGFSLAPTPKGICNRICVRGQNNCEIHLPRTMSSLPGPQMGFGIPAMWNPTNVPLPPGPQMGFGAPTMWSPPTYAAPSLVNPEYPPFTGYPIPAMMDTSLYAPPPGPSPPTFMLPPSFNTPGHPLPTNSGLMQEGNVSRGPTALAPISLVYAAPTPVAVAPDSIPSSASAASLDVTPSV